MSEADALYLGHMLDTARKAIARVDGRSREDFDANEDLRIVLTWLIQVVGEAASRVSRETRDAHPAIPWRPMIGMRHRLVHDYMHIDEDVVWTVATQNLPDLVRDLAPLIPPSPPEP